MNDVLRLEAISKSYNPGTPAAVSVLSDLNLSVARAEVVALVAPSGAGKSTLLHIAGLLDTPDAGRVVLDGRDMTGLPDRARTAARRERLGFVYQFHHLLPEFTALENVVLPQLANAVPEGRARDRARALLDRVGLSASPCWRRIKRLEDSGLITKRVTLLNAQLLGLNYNRGEKICLRLRESSDESAFLTRDAILTTYVCFSHTSMLHELAYVCCTDPATTCVDPMTMCSTIHYRHSLTNIPRRSAWGTGQAPAFSHPARVSAAAACLQMHGSGATLQLRRQSADRARQAVAHAWEEQRRHDP